MFVCPTGNNLQKLQLSIVLRQSVKEANQLIYPHNLLVGILDRGQLSCHKVVVSHPRPPHVLITLVSDPLHLLRAAGLSG